MNAESAAAQMEQQEDRQEKPQDGGEELRNRYDPAIAGALAQRITRRDFTSGDVAELRRMNPSRPASSAFWNLMLRYRITDPDSARDDNVQVEQAWGQIMAAIAKATRVGAEETTGPHNPAIPLGRALALAGYHEARLQALLNADPRHVQRLADNAAHFLNSKGQDYNCGDLARLMLSPLRSKAQRDADRTYIARHYHRELYHQSQG